MKRATITLPDDLEAELEAYLAQQKAPPSLTAVVQAALREYLRAQALSLRDYRPAKGPLRITPAEGSGATDVSINHDRYFAEAEKGDE
jgi:hypothetical protein